MCDATADATIDLPVSLDAPSLARAFLRESVCRQHLGPLFDDAVVLTSEAITNAVLHGGPPIVLAIGCTGTGPEIRVRDGNRAVPQPRQPDDLDTGGRGMMLVDLLSSDWGVDMVPGDGKEVWFRLGGVRQSV